MNKDARSKWIIFGSAFSFLVLVFGWLFFPANKILDKFLMSAATTIPPRDLTQTNISAVETRLRDYWSVYGKLPENLSALPLRIGYDNSINDGWNRPLIYEVNGTLTTLRSLGRDDKVGGMGDDADFVRSFDVTKERDYLSSDF